jgi:Transposase DDE domain group 1
MTHCTACPLPFSSAKRRKIEADFCGGVLTSDAGALLLREADRQLGLIDALDRAIPDPRHPDLITHPQRALLAQRIFAIACGYEDLNDHDRLRDDPLWQTATDHPGPDNAPQLASPPTLCRLENRIRRATLVQLAATLVEQFIAAHPTPPAELVLDFDATDDPVHGRQENRFFHGYYDGYCFLPLYVMCGDHLLVAYLRPSNSDASRHTGAVLKLLVQRLRQAWPDVRIVVRADSGFCRWRLMRWCDRHRVSYLLGLAKNAVLQRNAAAWQAEAEQAHRADGQAHRVFGEFTYAAQSWDRPRRVIAKAEHLPGDKANPRFVVTDLPGDARLLYEQRYCQRGDMENRIKEQQLGLFADRTSCHRFVANQFRVLLAAAAYVLVSHVRRVGLAGTELARAEVGTIRLKLFKVGAWVKRSVRRVVVRLASSYPWQELFAAVARRLAQPRPSTAAGP